MTGQGVGRDRASRVALAVGLLLAGCVAGCAPAVERTAAEPSGRLDPPAAPGAFAPDLWADEEGVLLTWLEPRGAGHLVRFSKLEQGAWTPPVTIVEGNDFFANWADFPSAARAGDGTLYAHWLRKTAEETYAYSIYLARSIDGGGSWQEAGKLNDDSTDTEHGFVSWARDGESLRAFWLDGREMAHGGPMSLRTARVGAPAVESAVESVVSEHGLLDPRVCECCSTDASVSAAGPYVVYRDRSEEEIRDVYQARRVDDAWTAAAAVSEDGWRIEGCPVNGPETAADGSLVATAWFTAAGGAKVRAAVSLDGGATFGEPVLIDGDGPLGRVDVALDGQGGVLVSWLAREQSEAVVRLRRLTADGSLGGAIPVGGTAAGRSSGFPRLVRFGEAAYLAWVEVAGEEPSRIRLREIPLSAIAG